MPNETQNKIIHITRSFESLKNILRSKSLRLGYCREQFSAGEKRISIAVHPMICFSEYNLAEINSKKIAYGEYGIGFSKFWARKKKIGPVLYVSQNSLAAKGMSTLLRARQNRNDKVLPNNLRLPIIELKCFIKNEQGFNSHFTIKDFDFKSENEWRYVPEKVEINNHFISQNVDVYEKEKEIYNEKLLRFALKFEIKDIEVIFVSYESEIETLITELGISREIFMVSKWKDNR